MGLAGILTVALIVSADQSYAGVNGMRAVIAFAPASEQDPPAKGQIPVLSGLLDGIRELPVFAAPTPLPTSLPSAQPANAPVSVSGPQATSPAVTAPMLIPAPTATPAPIATPSPTPIPTTPPGATPSPTPTPAPVQVATDRGARSIVALSDLVPGDTIARTITVQNTGTLTFRYTVSASQTANTALWTDPTNGLQLTVADSGGLVLYSGPLSGLGFLSGPAILAPGDTELLRYTFAFPASASDAFQRLVQDLTLVFSATQFP
jgi:hypothetical protein